MIRISQQNSAKEAKRYYTTADYYSQGQETVGRWGGRGAERLGLSGLVDKLAFEQLCDNLDPNSGEPLTVRTKRDRTVGYDFTFSVPKSISLVYGLTGDESLLQAFRESVDETMKEIESEMQTRVRRSGRDENRPTGNLIWAEFVHSTSRPVDGLPDPHLHSHLFVFNTTYDSEENRWKAGQFREIKRDAPYFQAAFRVRLANKLKDLGFGVSRKRDDFELTGLPSDLLKRFSRRTTMIDDLARERGIEDPDEKALLGAESRQRKKAELSMTDLRQAWLERLSSDEVQRIEQVADRAFPPVPGALRETMAVDYAIEHLFVRDSVVAERKILTEALKRGLGEVTIESTAQELKDRPLIRTDENGQSMATTAELVDLESRLIAFARAGRGRFRPLGDPDREIRRKWLNAGQVGAVRHVLASRDRVTLVRGVAGTGKTTLEQELGEALVESGRIVVALAPSIKASRGVLREEAGFAEAETVARFLKDQALQEKAHDGVILVDEASLIGTRDLCRLFAIAESVQARLVLVGDRRQHRSVSAGEPLKLLEEEAGLPVAEVTEILRQQGDYKKAARALSEGRAEEGLVELDKLGWIRELGADDRYRSLAGDYLDSIRQVKHDGTARTALIVSPTHAEAAIVTREIRNQLHYEGRLRDEHFFQVWRPAHWTDAEKLDATFYNVGDLIQFYQNAPGFTKSARLVVSPDIEIPLEHASRYQVYHPESLPIAIGDRIRITASGKTKAGQRLVNGTLYTVSGFTRSGDLIVNHGLVIDRDYGHIAHGYASTSHSSQGSTVDQVFIAIAGSSFAATDQRTAYVAVTRGKQKAVIYTDDKAELFEAVKRLDQPLSATDLVKKQEEKRSRPQQPLALSSTHREQAHVR